MSKWMAGLAILVTGCSWTQATASLKSLGKKATVTCYSGDRVIFAGRSTGKVVVHQGGQHSFADSATGQLVEVTGTCVTLVDP